MRRLIFALLFACACSSPPSRGVASAPTSAPSPAPSLEGSSASASKSAESSDDAAIEKAAHDYVDLVVALSPEQATALGLHQRDADLDDRTIAGEDAAIEREEAFLRALKERFANPRASAAAKTDLALLVGELEVDIRRRRVVRPLQRDPGAYLEPLHSIFLLTARDFAPAVDRARSALSRIEKLPKVLDLARENLLNPPKVWTEVAIEKAASAKTFLEAQRAFLTNAQPGEKARVDAALKAANAALDDYKKFLETTVLKRSNGRFAAGRELFEFLLVNEYFVDKNAQELYAIGKKVFAETTAQMTVVAKRIDPAAKDWPSVTAKIKAKHPAADELLDAYRKEVARARAFLAEKDAIAFPDGDDLDVTETPAFKRNVITAAYDRPPPFDTTTSKGFFFVTPVDKAAPKAKQEETLRENDWADVVNTTVHEAYPGHHLQLSFARKSASTMRKVIDRAIFAEGWALYSEELMHELGYYDDEKRLIQLEWTLVRAARVVLDVGLHVNDLSFADAVKMLTDEVHLERALALSEVKRYTLTPTQPLSYLVGRQMIFDLRDRARTRDGARFSLKSFHSELLAKGTIPPGLIAREMGLEGQR